MRITDTRVIHRFVRNIEDYEFGGEYYAQIIPLDTQVYAQYNSGDKKGLWYVLGDGEHTYLEIRDGKGSVPSAKEYPVYDGNGSGEISLKDYRKAEDQDIIDNEIKDSVSTLGERVDGVEQSVDAVSDAVNYVDNKVSTFSRILTAVRVAVRNHIGNKNNPHKVTKEQIGLGRVDNTSDLEKPVSHAVHKELDKKADASEIDKINKRMDAIVTNDTETGKVILDDGSEKAVVFTAKETEQHIIKNINEAINIKSDEPVVHLTSNNDETDVYTKRGVDALLDNKLDKKDLPDPYELPTASKDTLGGIKIGAGLKIDSTGTLSTLGGDTGVSSVNEMTGDVVLDANNLKYNGETLASLFDKLLTAKTTVTKVVDFNEVSEGEDKETGDKYWYVEIEHNMNKFPAIQVFDTAGSEYFVDVRYDTANKLTILFENKYVEKGTVYLN